MLADIAVNARNYVAVSPRRTPEAASQQTRLFFGEIFNCGLAGCLDHPPYAIVCADGNDAGIWMRVPKNPEYLVGKSRTYVLNTLKIQENLRKSIHSGQHSLGL
jgi:hypothetical protein